MSLGLVLFIGGALLLIGLFVQMWVKGAIDRKKAGELIAADAGALKDATVGVAEKVAEMGKAAISKAKE